MNLATILNVYIVFNWNFSEICEILFGNINERRTNPMYVAPESKVLMVLANVAATSTEPDTQLPDGDEF